MWSTCSFGFYLLSFQLKYLQGSIFTNSYYSSMADLLAALLGYVVFVNLGINISFAISYFIAIIGAFGICIFYQQSSHTDQKMEEVAQLTEDSKLNVYILIVRFGISLAY